MPEYIEREAAIAFFDDADTDIFNDFFGSDDTEWGFSRKKVMGTLMLIPAADVEPVRHGRWIWVETGPEDYEQYWICSECGESNYYEAKFCPNCGAKMDGRNETVKVQANCFDKEEIHENCTVQVLTNTVTGEVSVGWWKNDMGKWRGDDRGES